MSESRGRVGALRAAWLRPRTVRVLHLTTVASALALIAMAVAPYLPVIHSYFLGDDFGLIRLFEKRQFSQLLTYFWHPWTEDVYGIRADELRPTLAFSYWLDGRLFGADQPLGFHLDNLVVHAACTLLIWWLARMVIGRAGIAFAAAALFAVTSVHAEAVTWISGRADLIPTACLLAAFAAFVRYRQGAPPGWLGVACLAFLLGLFSKQSLVTFPALLLAFDLIYGHLGLRRGHGWLRLFLPHVPFALGVAGYLALRRVLFGQMLREDSLTWSHLYLALDRQPSYLAGVLYGRQAYVDLTSMVDASALGLALAAVIGWLLAFRRQARCSGAWRQLLFFGPVWYSLTTLPLIGADYYSPRHVYAATAGTAIALAVLVWLVQRNPASLRQAVLPVALMGSLLGFQLGQLERANGLWLYAGTGSARGVAQLEQLARELPPRSKIVLSAPANYIPTPISRSSHDIWFWGWAMPYATEPPFASGQLYQRHEVIEDPDIYCCPGRQWWARRGGLLRRWLSEGPSIQITYIRWHAPTADFVVERRPVETTVLRNRLERVLGYRLEVDVIVTEAGKRALMTALQQASPAGPR